MAILRKKKGNLLFALVAFILALAIIICGMYLGPYKEISLFSMAFGTSIDLSHMEKIGEVFRDMKINVVYLIAYVGPLVFSLLALLFRRYRFINLLSFCSFALAVFSPIGMMWATGIGSLKDILSDIYSLYYIIVACQGVGLVLSLLNLELCR